jgi:hypothetical protein
MLEDLVNLETSWKSNNLTVESILSLENNCYRNQFSYKSEVTGNVILLSLSYFSNILLIAAMKERDWRFCAEIFNEEVPKVVVYE